MVQANKFKVIERATQNEELSEAETGNLLTALSVVASGLPFDLID